MPDWFTQPFATLIAASVALLVSIVNVIITVRHDSRGAFRDLLTEHVADLSDSLHQIVATSAMIPKTKTPESHKSWCERGGSAKDKLMACRNSLRYPLWGVTDPMGTLAKLPSWVAHAKAFPEYTQRLVDQGDIFSVCLDKAVFYAVMKGRRPSLWHRMRVSNAEKKLKKIYKDFQGIEKTKANKTCVATGDNVPS